MSSRLADTVLDVPADRLLLADLSGAEVVKAVGELAGMLRAGGVTRQTVGLQGSNGASWVIGLLGLLRAGARPLLVGHDSPPPDVHRLLAAAGAARCLRTEEGQPPRLTGITGARGDKGAHEAGAGAAVLLASSGSTGAAKLVTRSERSLLDEGRRYLTAGLITTEDMLALPLPMSHAYALGWTVAALLAGARLCPVPPRSLGAASDILAAGATVLAVVPGLARILARRLAGGPGPHVLRLVMAGADYVDSELDARWSVQLGVGLSRNYGSSETGAVLAGPAGLPSGCVGLPLPGVEVILRGDHGEAVAGAGTGEIVVRVEDGTWHRMGDLAERDESGRYTIIGRRAHGTVRRGARWVSTLEVAAVLGKAYGVADVCVAAEGGDADDQGLTAEYVPAGAWVTPAALAAYAREQLAPYKIPVAFRLRAHLHRGAPGKAQHAPEYRLTSQESLIEAMRAYRRSEMIFALGELGALPMLAAGVSAADLAGALDLEPETMADLLEVARELGLLTVTDPAGEDLDEGSEAPDAGPELAAMAVAERPVHTGITSQGLAAARAGTPSHGSEAGHSGRPTAHTAEILKLARVVPDETLLQIGSGAPRYTDAGPYDVDPPEACCDVCFVIGAVHGPGPAQDLIWLASRLRPAGRLVIEDRFLDSPYPTDATARLAWLARGARRWWHVHDLQAGLESIGMRISSVIPLPDSEAIVLIAHRSQ